MDAAATLKRARREAGLTLRTLAERAGTSHATLAAYEAGRAIPRVDTLDRILRAAGYASDITTSRRIDDGATRGDELWAALELAAMFPARHAKTLPYPVFPGRR